MNLNKVFVLGRLTADPQLRTTPSGTSVGTFSIATNRVWMDKSGKKQEETEFHNIVVWGRQAEIAGQFLFKGSMVLIEGRLQTRSWQDKQGQARKTTEIVCEQIQLGPKSAGGGTGGGQGQWSGGQGKSGGGNQSSPAMQDNQDIPEDIPIINVDEDEIRPEDLPF